MEALSPRDVNARVKKQQSDRKVKEKVVEKPPQSRSLQREKDHPAQPPAQIIEPPSFDRPNGAIYKTGKLLGKGGFAICYEGTLTEGRAKQIFALKVVQTHMPQKKMAQKFQTELQIHSKMKHPNIVNFQRAFTFETSTFIVLELCPNGSLMDMIKKRRFVTEPEVRFYTIQMAGAIKYMHNKGIIHRDLKMGNIFLDKDMNVKVGDFGLAALLMSGKEMNACRRTTLCGTPNYLAPEILEKGKKGHDHAVDIWSLGIIIFALLTGKPPFQSTTQDEIYRKAREREYDWPELSKTNNYIGQEAKDLVSMLLQMPEDRPDPDTIVQHSFFSSGWVPFGTEMSPRFRDEAPGPNEFVAASLLQGVPILYAKNLRKLCALSEVGPHGKSIKILHSTYREVDAEEKAGLTPIVPLAPGIVYRPFDEVNKELKAVRDAEDAKALSNKEEVKHNTQMQDFALPARIQKSNAIRPPHQSFAAQQRAQYQPPSAAPRVHTSVSTNETVSSRRPAASSSSASRSRSSASIPLSKDSAGISRSGTVSSHRNGTSIPFKLTIDLPVTGTITSVETVQARIGIDLVKQLNQAEVERLSGKDDEIQEAPETGLSIFSPSETVEPLPSTAPSQILAGLKKLNAELERALNSRSIGPQRVNRSKSRPNIVIKWVDYTNKFGLGYILSNGTVGCVFRSSTSTSGSVKGRVPATCVVVRNAEQHLQLRMKHDYRYKSQYLPMNGPPVEFYEIGDEYITKGKVSPASFRIPVGDNGEAGSLPKGRDEWDHRKREKIVIWKKFADYMTAYGKDQEFMLDDAMRSMSVDRDANENDNGSVVTFYQRFGDVGCWAFGDGHFQFNFPDHTKIVLSSDGLWCEFYHLPLEDARDLAATGSLSPAALDDRQHLSYPLQTLLNFMEKPARSGRASTRYKDMDIDPLKQGIPAANDFRRKIQFIKSVVNEWVLNGGLGNSNMTPEGRLRWLGYREKINVKVPVKHVWVTVGAKTRDERHVAWFDPNKPKEIVPDIE